MTTNSDYSNLTCIRYNQALTSIRKIYEETLHSTFQNPESLRTHSQQIIEMLSTRYQKSTMVNFISAILWNLSRLDQSSISYIDELSETYRAYGKTIKDDIEHSRIGKEFQLTDKEKKSFMIWEDILKIYTNVSSNVHSSHYNQFMDFVILSLYVLHPPARADYANMKLFIDDSHVPPSCPDNYCVLQTNPRFVFNQYKTAKHRGSTTILIDPELHNILLDWAQLNSSDYLLASYASSTQTYTPITENKLSKKITSIFVKYSKRPVTINTLRHSFISYMSKHDQEHNTKKNNANKMMHSLSMADKYRRMVYLE